MKGIFMGVSSSSELSGERFAQLGGLSGILASIVFLAFGLPLAPSWGFPESGHLNQFLTKISSNSTGFILLNTGWAAVFILAMVFYLGLYSFLRKQSIGYALVGGVAGIIAAASFAVLQIINASAFLSLAPLYNDAATAADRAVFLAAAEGVNATTGGLEYVEAFFRIIAFLAFGAAMLADPLLERRYGWLAIAYGLAVVAIVPGAQYFSPLFTIDALALMAMFIIFGQRLLRMPRMR